MNRIITLLLVFLVLFSSTVFASVEKINEFYTVIVEEEIMEYDVQPKLVGGKLMLPLRLTLEEMGYNLQWNSVEKSVEVSKNVHFTKIFIGENAYFKHKMAPFALSSEPIISNSRTLVPIEFFHEVLGLSFEIKENQVVFSFDEEETLVTHMGYVSKIVETEYGTQYHLSHVEGEEVYLLINTGKETIFQREVEKGDFIKTVSPPIMLLSYPGQSGAIVVY